MKIDILYSGSSGNTCHIYTQNTSILIDCGVSLPKLFARGEFPLDAIFITHEHGDHLGGVGIVARSTNAKVYLEQLSFENKRPSINLDGSDLKYISSGDTIDLGDFLVEAHKTSHDSNGGIFFIVEDKNTKLRYGHLTDTGIITESMTKALQTCDALLLEANHNVNTLMKHPSYNDWVRERIRGDFGHLSNDQTMEFIRDNLDFDKLRWIVFGHLSQRTNSPEKVMEAKSKSIPKFRDVFIAPINLALE